MGPMVEGPASSVEREKFDSQRGQFLILTHERLWTFYRDGAQVESGVSRRDLPRHESGRPARTHLQRRRGSAAIRRDLGRVWDSEGQSGGAATVGTGVGGAAWGGGGRGVQVDPARLVFGRGDVSEGIAGADKRAAGGGALRRGTRGNGRSEGRTNHRGGVEAAKMEVQ